ncbi:MAG: FtsX-like permease family protein [Opitutaceae bacterium]
MSVAVTRLLFRRFTLRHAKLAPRSTALLVGILGLGVAVFVSIRLANRAAVSSFANFTDVLTGQSDFTIQAPAGTLPESVLPELRAALGARPVDIIPLVEETAAQARLETRSTPARPVTYTLLGVDLISLANLAGERSADGGYFQQGPGAPGSRGAGKGAEEFWKVYTAGPQLWVSRAFAAVPPATLDLVLGENVRTLRVAGVIPTARGAPPAPATLMVLDLPQLQALVGKVGRLDRVEFLVESGPRATERRAELGALLEQVGHGRWTVSTPTTHRESAETMTRAFRLNLTILSLIALLVGLYLIFQALDGAVVRRRTEIAILRSLGVEERSILLAWLAESALIGLLGGAVGVLLGWIAAQFAVRAVGETVNALYFATTVHAAGLRPGEAALGLGLGVAASLAAGWWPARMAARTAPAQVLSRAAAPAPGRSRSSELGLGIGLILLGTGLCRLPPVPLPGFGRFPLAGYAAALAWIFGGGLVCGWIIPALAHAARALGRRWAPARIALSHLRRPSGRHRLAVAALHCAVGMAAGMAILVTSFEQTVRGWIDHTLQADLYIGSEAGASGTAQSFISVAAMDRLVAHPAVAASARLTLLPLNFEGVTITLAGADLAVQHRRGAFAWVRPPPDEAVWEPTRNAALALVSEAFAERFHRAVGATVRVATPAGAQTLTIAGIFADYGNERGTIMVDRAQLRKWFADDRATHVSLWLKPAADAETVRAELRREFPGLAIYTNVKLRAEVLRIFRQTFGITYALEIIGVLVAVVGLALTLTSVLLDRREELTTLRALGFDRHELASAAALEGAGIATTAVAGGLTLSLALGWLLIHVINKQSFGWTLSFGVPWGQLAAVGASVVATGILVSYVVGRWGANLPADREE